MFRMNPLYPFGFGLSYTSFLIVNLSLSQKSLSSGAKSEVKVTVTNTGNLTGKKRCNYIHAIWWEASRSPVKELKGFQKVFLKRGESKEITFTMTADDLRFYNNDLKYIYEPGDFKVFVGGNSQRCERSRLLLY